MSCRFRSIATALLACLAIGSLQAKSDAERTAFAWPNGARAAINLAYDDALDSHLDNAIPALERHGFRGSFYLTLARDGVRLRLDEWRAAAHRGHELGNHTLYHPCSASLPGREWVQPRHDLDHMTRQALLEEIRVANAFLYAIDGQTQRTFTAPCGDLYAGGEYYIDAIRPLFVAIKARSGEITPDMNELDPHLVAVVSPNDVTGEQLIAIARRAADQGTMANFTFHGIGGDYLSVSAEAHEQLLTHLAEHPDRYWVDTFLAIMMHVDRSRTSDAATSVSEDTGDD